MKSLCFPFLLLSGLALAEPEKIFDGASLAGWEVKGAPYWKAVDGVLVGQSDAAKKPSILWTKAEFGDFVLRTEFRFEGDIDSGIFLRRENEQIQIGVSRSLKRDMTGSPYIGSKGTYPVEAKGVKDLLKPGAWNRLEIGVEGATYTVKVNGREVLEYESDTAKEEKGPIGLQIHAGVEMKIEFRGLEVDAAGSPE
jgi:hypothetical protein